MSTSTKGGGRKVQDMAEAVRRLDEQAIAIEELKRRVSELEAALIGRAGAGPEGTSAITDTVCCSDDLIGCLDDCVDDVKDLRKRVKDARSPRHRP